MDKEAQEEIARELARQDDELIWEHLKPELQALFLVEAGQILQLLEQLGYRKLPEGQPPLLTPKEVWEMLVKHKEYQRRWKGKLQVLFGFSPDELDKIREGKL